MSLRGTGTLITTQASSRCGQRNSLIHNVADVKDAILSKRLDEIFTTQFPLCMTLFLELLFEFLDYEAFINVHCQALEVGFQATVAVQFEQRLHAPAKTHAGGAG